MKKNIVRIKAPGTPVSSVESATPKHIAATKPMLEASELNETAEEFIPRPWVNVKPRFPWRPAIAVFSILVLVAVAAFFLKPEPDNGLDPEAEVALMSEAMPNLDRHADPYDEATDTEAETADAVIAADSSEEGSEAELLQTLIVKVSDNQIRANGKLVTLNDLSKLCKTTGDNATLKLINRRGDAKIVEAVARVLDSSQLHYHYVNN